MLRNTNLRNEKEQAQPAPGDGWTASEREAAQCPQALGNTRQGTARQRRTETEEAAAAEGGAAGPSRTVPPWEAGGRLHMLACAPIPRGSARRERRRSLTNPHTMSAALCLVLDARDSPKHLACGRGGHLSAVTAAPSHVWMPYV